MKGKKTNNYLGRNLSKKRSDDRLTPEERSLVMSKIRSKNTKFEKDFLTLLRSATRKRFRTNVNSVLGKPDIVFLRAKVCVFLDSDFWHGWQFPRWKHQMKNEFWVEKIERNRKRDRKVTRVLRKHGWTVLRLWEHQIKGNPDVCVAKITSHL